MLDASLAPRIPNFVFVSPCRGYFNGPWPVLFKLLLKLHSTPWTDILLIICFTSNFAATKCLNYNRLLAAKVRPFSGSAEAPPETHCPIPDIFSVILQEKLGTDLTWTYIGLCVAH